MTVSFHGVRVDRDYSGMLATAPGNPPSEIIPLNQKVGTVIHYAGGAQNRALGALTLWQSYARNHISRGRFASGVVANGLMYHYGVADDGLKAGLFDPRVTRWHAGATDHNRRWVSLNIPIGGNQDATYAQKVGMEEILHELWKLGVGDRQRVIGHMEASPSLCPGVLQHSFVREIRKGTRFAVNMDPPPPPAPEHVIFDVPGYGKFWIIGNIYKRWTREEQPLFRFGFPISGMRGSEEHGYTQWFERARMEHYPGAWGDRHDVLLGRIGAELAEARYPAEYITKRGPFEKMPRGTDSKNWRYFPESGYAVAHGFKSFWETWGGLEFFGFPISREFQEGGRTVQYFERARMEHHPEHSWDPMYHNVALGRVGAELMDIVNAPGDVIDPPNPDPDRLPLVSLDSFVPVAKPNDVTAKQMVNVCYALNRKPVYSPGKIQKIAESTHARSREFGFRTSLSWGQICHETGYFRFGGQVKPEQNNFAGLGATNDGAAGATFPSEDAGVLAVMCHLALYVYGDVPQWPKHLQQYGPQAIRRNAVVAAHATQRLPDGTLLLYLGTVTRVRDWLNGRWARTDSLPLGTLQNGYANGLVRAANEVISI